MRLLKILTTPDWNETLLDLLFDPNDRSYGKGVFEYDARENGIYLFSFLDSDITRLNHFIDGTKGSNGKQPLSVSRNKPLLSGMSLGRKSALRR